MPIQYFLSRNKVLQLPPISPSLRATTVANEKLNSPIVTYKLDSIYNSVTVDTIVTTMAGDTPNNARVKGLYDILKDKKIKSIDCLTPKFRVTVVYSILNDNGDEISGGNRFAFIEPEMVVVLSDINQTNKMSYVKELRFSGLIEHNVTDDIPYEVKFRKELHGYRLRMKNLVIEAHTKSEEEQMSTVFNSQKHRHHKDMTSFKGYEELFNLKKMFPAFSVEYAVDDRYRKINFTFCVSIDKIVELYSDDKIQQILAENNAPVIPPDEGGDNSGDGNENIPEGGEPITTLPLEVDPNEVVFP